MNAMNAKAIKRLRFQRHSRRDFLFASGLAALLTLGFGSWMALRIAGVDITQAVDDFGKAGAALIAVLACALAAFRHHGRARLAWALLGAAALVWAAGEAAHAGFLAAVPLAVA